MISTEDLSPRLRSRLSTSGGRVAPYAPGVRTVSPVSLNFSAELITFASFEFASFPPLRPPLTDAAAVSIALRTASRTIAPRAILASPAGPGGATSADAGPLRTSVI